MRKKLLAVLLILSMLLTGCGFIVVDDDSETILSGVLGAEAHGEAAHTNADIQKRLIELGFLSGKADGIIGPRSQAALSAFQTFCGFEATGEADDMTLDMLFGDPAALPTPSPTPLANGARDTDSTDGVKALQERLKELNYLSGSADGIFGKSTENALKSFQEMNGLEATGAADEKTLNAINAAQAVPMPTPEPTPRVMGAKGEDVKAVQEALQVMGFMGGFADGDYGNETDRSIKRYQQYVYDKENAFIAIDATIKPENTFTPEPTETPESTASIVLMDEIEDTPIAQITAEPTAAPYEPDGVLTDELMADILAYKNVTFYESDMQKGAKGDEVTRLQRRLASLWYLNTSTDIDGQFGGNTEKALKYFQKRNKLEETGLADEALQLLLFSAEAVKSDRPANLYKLKVSVSDQRVYAYKWVNGDYTELVKTMKCSTGTKDNPTPYGTFNAAGACGRWYYFQKFECWAQYAYRITGGILFHSVIYSQKDESTLRKSSVSNLGSRASHGCIRLAVDDAKWIYNNCPSGTTVVVY